MSVTWNEIKKSHRKYKNVCVLSLMNLGNNTYHKQFSIFQQFSTNLILTNKLLNNEECFLLSFAT